MSKRTEILRELIGLYESQSPNFQVEIWQDQPNTAARIFYYSLRKLGFFGFSKVCYPDKWDADYGVRIAVYKALGKIAKELAKDND